jgi:hypothetical protein
MEGEMKEERLYILKAFKEGLKKEDRRSINNGIYIGQICEKLPKYYEDFEGFGKLGVSSLTLHEDISFLKWRAHNLNIQKTSSNLDNVRRVGGIFSNFPAESLQLMACYLWYNGRNGILREDEKQKAAELVAKLKNST